MKTFTKKAIRQALFLLSFCWSLNYAMSISGESHNRSGFLPNTNAGDFLSSWEYDESFLTPEKQTACQTHYSEEECELHFSRWGRVESAHRVCPPNTLLQCLERAKYNISANQIIACGNHPDEFSELETIYSSGDKLDDASSYHNYFYSPDTVDPFHHSRYKYSFRIQCLESAIQYNLSLDQITACGHYEDPTACLDRAGQQNISFEKIITCGHYEDPTACLDRASQQNISLEKITACSKYQNRFLQIGCLDTVKQHNNINFDQIIACSEYQNRFLQTRCLNTVEQYNNINFDQIIACSEHRGFSKKECLIRAERHNINPAILTFCANWFDSINCLEKALQYKAGAESFLQNMVSWKIVPLPY